MRERSYRVNTEKLAALQVVYGGTNIANRLNISRQLWHRYTRGLADIPESKLNHICEEFKLDRDALALG